ncbi:MAG: AraC family transcriptional regulator [Pseudomonadota bacterium]
MSTARFADFRFEPHYHLDCHVALITKGVQRQSFKGETLLLAPGTIQLMPAGEVHDGTAAETESYTLQTFRLSPSLLKGLGEEVSGRHHFPAQAAAVFHDPHLADQLLQMHASLRQARADPMLDETRVLDLFEVLFARLLQPSPLTVAGTLSQQQLRRVRDFMQAHLSDRIVLDDVATLLGLDRFRFLKLFKRTVGMTPHAWLLRLRLESAMELIKANSHMAITDVAHAVGFFDQSHFTHAFRHAYGVTPASFRQPSGNFLQGIPVGDQ